jgi:hypothetical protein
VIRELRTDEDFQQAVTAGYGVIVITDTTHPPRAHSPACPHIDLRFFVEKIVENGGKNGAYFWADGLDTASSRLDATPCDCL